MNEFEKSQMKISSSVEGASKALACMRTNMSTQTTFSVSLFCAYIYNLVSLPFRGFMKIFSFLPSPPPTLHLGFLRGRGEGCAVGLIIIPLYLPPSGLSPGTACTRTLADQGYASS